MVMLGIIVLCIVTNMFGNLQYVNAAEIGENRNLKEILQEQVSIDSEVERGIFTVYYEVIVSKTAIRSGAGNTYSCLGYAYKGKKFKKISEKNGWIKIDYGSGNGYIIKSDLKKL